MRLVLKILTLAFVLTHPNLCLYAGKQEVKLEADYILSCQYLNSTSKAFGAFNNVTGDPTWVVPGENAIAIMGLVTASNILNDNLYKQRAELNAKYLENIQKDDGSWYSQYIYADPEASSDKGLRHTAEIMIAYDKLGYNSDRYISMKKASEFILSCQNVTNKQGIDDGLVGGGKDSLDNYHTYRWTSDNAFAYQALKTAANWAYLKGEYDYQKQLNQAADKILTGIKTYLTENNDHFKRVIDSSGNTVLSENNNDWIKYAPLMLDVDVDTIDPLSVGSWIHSQLQDIDGSLLWENPGVFDERKSPGYSFQAMLSWMNLQGIQFEGYSASAFEWALASGLWDETNGGWIDWIENGTQAPSWQKFIDTSAYYIMVENGGFDFSPKEVPEPLTAVFFFLSASLLWFKKRKISQK